MTPENSLEPRTRLPRRRKLAYLGLTYLVLVIAAELVLQILCLVSNRVDQLLAVRPGSAYRPKEDAQLGLRPAPNDHPDHDARGFRNRAALAQADVVVLGDSQTYGAGVEREEAWPQQLAQRSGADVYNFAFHGWGPTHGLVLLDEALALQPRVVVYALYSGNDLYDSFEMVYGRGQLPELRTNDAQIRQAIERVQNRAARPPRRGIREIIIQDCKLFGFFRAINRALTPSPDWEDRRKGTEGDERFVAFETGNGIRTIFTPRYRLVALNLTDTRIREGLRLSLESIRRMHERTLKSGAEFLVIGIPTKELVFLDQREGPTSFGGEYDLLVRHEQFMWDQCRRFFEKHEIEFTDALEAMRSAQAAGKAAYRETIDGHPSPAGHAAIAGQVFEALQATGWKLD